MAESAETPGHQPYVPDDKVIPEFTWPAVLVGAILGLVFGASSLYLVLKVGMTVSASIPVAVLSITLFRGLSKAFGFRPATILENNITQTTGSAGESIAFGVGVTMPAMMLIGFEMEWSRVMVVSVLGGLLGILMMIPLRRAFIVKLHGKPGEPGKLLYPEGTACAQVLISGEKGGTSGKTVFIGFGVAFLHKFLTEGMSVLKTTVAVPLDFFSSVARVTSDMASELLGVGYIIGVRTASVMMAGAILGGLVLTPALALGLPSGTTFGDIYKNYLRFIGAGCVAAAGIISMGKTLPLIVRSFLSGLSNLRGETRVETIKRRTEDDLPPSVVFVGSIVLLGLLAAFLMQEVTVLSAVLGAVLVLLFGFLFVTVSSRLTGEIGSSSNPISGMTIATLLLTSLIFLMLGMTSPSEAVLALSIGGVVCIAASNGGTTSQDLKTGYLVGGTPRLQQIAILIGALVSAVVIGGTLLLFNSVGTVYSQRNLPPVHPPDLTQTTETELYNGETYRVWRPNTEIKLPSVSEPGQEVKVRPGKYLVDSQGEVCYRVDPTITGELDQRDEWVQEADGERAVTLDGKQLAAITDTVALRRDKGNLVYYLLWNNNKAAHAKAVEEGERAKKEGKETPPPEPYLAQIPDGEYLLANPGKTAPNEQRQLTLAFKDEPRKVSMKFEAPKTQVMGIVINGLLQGNLKWSLVLIGAFLSIGLELCGISSLAFAVGVYIPMQYSTPIFLGGLSRWGVDAWAARLAHQEIAMAGDAAARAEAEVRAITRSETSPGVLLSSGLIAGGSLAGVLIAFLEFSPRIKDSLDWGKSMEAAFAHLPHYLPEAIAAAVFAVLVGFLLMVGCGKLFPPAAEDDNHNETR